MSDITTLLNEAFENPGSKANEALLQATYDELKQIAIAKMAKEYPGHTLQPTALVNDAWGKLFPEGRNANFKSRAHFFGAAARSMRNQLVDHARKRLAEKRGAGCRKTQWNSEKSMGTHNVASDEFKVVMLKKASDELIEAVDEVLHEIEREDPKTFAVVQMKFFLDMKMKEVAKNLGVSLTTVEGIYKEFKKKHKSRFENLV